MPVSHGLRLLWLPKLLPPLLPEAALPTLLPPELPVKEAVKEAAHEAPRLTAVKDVGSVGAQMTAPGRRRMPGGGGSSCSMAWSGGGLG